MLLRFSKAENEFDLYSNRTGIDKQDVGNYGLLPG